MATESQPSSPGVHFPPPILFVLGVVLAWLLETRVRRIRLLSGSASAAPLEAMGVALLAAGILLIFWGLFIFARAKTGIIPNRPATRIVDYGPYAFTRNPMYTGMTIAYLGGVLILNSVWMLILLPLVILALYRLVIQREERYLVSAFPQEYEEYRRKVRRWL
ncbi:MAG: isoprenylcysteine carboxylmethyltransferase family protein [Gemmatimonadales bacterium]